MGDEMLKTEMYPHQKECEEYSESHKKFLLGDEQGLGKTLEVINIAVKNKHPNTHCLIICGVNGLKYNWYNEVHKHSYEDAHILGQKVMKNGKIKIGSNKDKLDDLFNIDSLPYFIITNIETLRYKRKTGSRIRKGKKYIEEVVYPISDKIIELCECGKISIIAADECHKMKNPDSEQGTQFLRVKSDREVVMTGTPLMNTPLDLYIILKWLGYEDHSFYQFKFHFCRLGGFGGHEVVGYKNLNQLQKLLDKMMLRRLKSEVLPDLPDKIYIDEYVEMSDKQASVYLDVYKKVKEEIDLIIASPNPLARLIRLRQATGYTGILSSKIKESAKLDRLEELVEDIVSNNQKVIIFSNWTQITDEISNRLLKYNPLVITGDTPDADRPLIIDKFQTDEASKVIIGTIGALGTGVTLTEANNVIFFDEPWNNALKEQAVDRTHRIGQKNSVNVYTLLTKNTIDERVHQLVLEKKDLSDAIIDKAETVSFLLS